MSGTEIPTGFADDFTESSDSIGDGSGRRRGNPRPCAMNISTQNVAVRRELLTQLFPSGIPRLWCPALTHFSDAQTPDFARIETHLQKLAPDVRGLLIPGSTGEGWEMSDADIRGLLQGVLPLAKANGQSVLIGVLKTTTPAVLQCLQDTISWLVETSGASSPLEAMQKMGVVGFTVCPPQGADLSQNEIESALRQVLQIGVPTALYQLPQVTQNEMAPELVAKLAAEFPNFLLFKDTSGRDVVANSRLDLGGVFLVRGAEGHYCDWTKAGGGVYDGLLLSTANVFAPQYSEIFRLLDAGETENAAQLSARVSQVVAAGFELAGGIALGNPFTNTNKLFDHVLAHGKKALEVAPPLLYSGTRLPQSAVQSAAELLEKAGLAQENM